MLHAMKFETILHWVQGDD